MGTLDVPASLEAREIRAMQGGRGWGLQGLKECLASRGRKVFPECLGRRALTGLKVGQGLQEGRARREPMAFLA